MCVMLSCTLLIRLSMLAEPLDKGLSADLERGAVDLKWDQKKVSTFFQSKYNWDVLAGELNPE